MTFFAILDHLVPSLPNKFCCKKLAGLIVVNLSSAKARGEMYAVVMLLQHLSYLEEIVLSDRLSCDH